MPDVLPEDYKVCPELPHCGLNCDLVKDEDGCTVCACQTPPLRYYPPTNDTAPDAANDKRICPEVKCDLHCERGLVMDENDCTFCECKPSTTGCPPLVGCRKRCSFGYKTNKRGCPVSNSRIRVITRLFKVSSNNRPRFLADMPLSSFLHGPFERDASGGIDLASEQLHHVYLRNRRTA